MKLGDKVRIVCSDYMEDERWIGKTGRILSVHSRATIVKMDDTTGPPMSWPHGNIEIIHQPCGICTNTAEQDDYLCVGCRKVTDSIAIHGRFIP